MPPWLSLLLDPVNGIVKTIASFIPNPEERQRAEQAMQAQLLQAAFTAESEQRKINETEAKSSSLFIAGWRPAVGWLCVFGLGWQFFVSPMLTWILIASGSHVPPLPIIGDATLTDLLYALLGVATLRTAGQVIKPEAMTKAIGSIFKKK